jgi:hypothetical protein
MKISFTGTRHGMSPEQKEAVRELFRDLDITLLIHGDCLGADAEAHDLAMELGSEVHIRPADIPPLRAHKEGVVVADPAPPLERDEDIVLDGEVLVATPYTDTEVKRSGTWYTVRCARKHGRDIYIVKRDGSVVEE